MCSFHATDLFCFVLVHHGAELWREWGLPDAATIVPLLLSTPGATGPATD